MLTISATELATRINDPLTLVVDTRSFSEYLEGHIPRAVNVDLFQYHWVDTSAEGIREFERQTKLLLSNLGVRANHKVIFYDNISGMSASRGVWLLLYFSHKEVSLLDGGFEEWKNDGYTIETGTNAHLHSNFVGKPNRSLLATIHQVKQSLRSSKSVIIDARTKEEFSGVHIRAARRGHIPSALNVNWEENLENGSFKSIERLSKLYSNIPRDSKIITYCQGGYRAANTFLALKILGYKDVKLYLSSWGEWGNKVNLPVER